MLNKVLFFPLHISFLPGASMGNPACGQGQEERGLTKRKGGVRPQGSPWTFLSIYPQNQSLPALLHYAFHLFFWHYRGAIPDHLSLEKVNRAPVNSLLHIKGVSQLRPLWWLSNLPDRFTWTFTTTYVIVYSPSTVRGTGSLKHRAFQRVKSY